MADKKLPNLSLGGLGDITSLLHNQGVSDLSWLAVDEADYRASEALPKQNLDIIPELTKALAEEDDVPHAIPLRPHTIVNKNPIHNSNQTAVVDATAPIRNRVATMVMANLPSSEIEKRIRLEFAPDDIRMAANDIRHLLNERGLIGNVYVDAKHFPRIAHDPKVRKLARSLSKNAMFVIGGCGGCEGCNCHQTGICNTFGGKKVVDQVPYTSSLAATIAPRLASESRAIEWPSDSSDSEVWKDRIRSAFLKTPVQKNPDGIKTIQTQQPVKKPVITASDVEAFWANRFAKVAPVQTLSPGYVKYARRMMQGKDDTELLVASGSPELARLASQIGLLGHSYLDMDVLGGCRNTLELIRTKQSAGPDFVIRRQSSCTVCRNTDDGGCAEISRLARIVPEVPVMGRQEFATSLQRAVLQGRIRLEHAKSAAQKVSSDASTDFGQLVARINRYTLPVASEVPYVQSAQKAFYGYTGSDQAKPTVNPEEIRQTISHFMNTGLTGKSLQAAILSRYSKDDLQQVPEIGRRASAEDGIQGKYFIDPTAYSDYGRGCDQGAQHFRKRGAQFLLASSKCTGCTLQTHPGWCSKFAKDMIRQVPTEVRKAITASRKSLPVVSTPVENPVEKYELASEMSVDLSGSKSRAINIELDSSSLDD